MATGHKLVNLDGMIERADFATADTQPEHYETIDRIAVRDLTKDGLIGRLLRKPDFQRETNHWSAEQVASLLECFATGELIPSVILWQSPSHLFVIDGGHRLSALRAWIEDDYGDGAISQGFFGYSVSKEQMLAADRCRTIVNERIGSYKRFESEAGRDDLPPDAKRRVQTIASRGLPIQWVKGDADKAEGSFFRINTKGTPLDEIEELLLRNRRRPVAIAARAIIRSGKGHRYWSRLGDSVRPRVEADAGRLHNMLFEPELERPTKTLDLPLGGPKGIRTALEVLLEFMLIASRNQKGVPVKLGQQPEDEAGDGTVKCLGDAIKIAERITGNDKGSLGLHPVVYFYGPTARHSSAMFLGTVSLVARKIRNNDKSFFPTFSKIRSRLESALILHKELIATILQKTSSNGRTQRYEKILQSLIDSIAGNEEVSEQSLVDNSGLSGKVLTGVQMSLAEGFSDDVKSRVFVKAALASAMRCPICSGYVDPEKSMSYDHIMRVRERGGGGDGNLQLTHPYCNQSVKG